MIFHWCCNCYWNRLPHEPLESLGGLRRAPDRSRAFNHVPRFQVHPPGKRWCDSSHCPQTPMRPSYWRFEMATRFERWEVRVRPEAASVKLADPADASRFRTETLERNPDVSILGLSENWTPLNLVLYIALSSFSFFIPFSDTPIFVDWLSWRIRSKTLSSCLSISEPSSAGPARGNASWRLQSGSDCTRQGDPQEICPVCLVHIRRNWDDVILECGSLRTVPWARHRVAGGFFAGRYQLLLTEDCASQATLVSNHMADSVLFYTVYY